jgi:hypothetical protein
VPFSDLVVAHPSPGCPPLATQVTAFSEVQVKVTDCPTVIEVGAADNVTVGKVTATVAVAVALTPCAMQVKA